MAFIRDYLKRFFRSPLAWTVLGIWILHSFCYELMVHLTEGKEIWLVHIALDDRIPFVEWFIFPYVFWYFWLLFAFLWSFWKSRRLFARLSVMAFLCNAASMICYLVVPNGLALSMRPDFDSLGRSNIATFLVKLLYEIDTPPRVVMPSMHCSICVVLIVFFCTARPMKGKWAWKCAAVLMALLIMMATVFVKQHSFLDVVFGVITGIGASAIAFLAEYGFDRFRRRKKSVKEN